MFGSGTAGVTGPLGLVGVGATASFWQDAKKSVRASAGRRRHCEVDGIKGARREGLVPTTWDNYKKGLLGKKGGQQ